MSRAASQSPAAYTKKMKFDSVASLAQSRMRAGWTASCSTYYKDGESVQGLLYDILSPVRAAFLGVVPDGYIDIQLANGNIAALRVNDSLNVKQAGGVCDGVVNDFEFVQAAKDYCIAKGIKSLSLKSASYSGELVISGASKLNIDATDATATADEVDKVPLLITNSNRVNLKGLAAAQPMGANSGYLAAPVVVSNSQIIGVENCFLDATNFNGVVYSNVSRGFIRNNTITSSTVDPETVVTNNTSSGAALFDGTNGVKVKGNTISRVGIGVNVQAIAAGANVDSNTVTANEIFDCYGYGVNAYSLASLVGSTVISNNVIYDIYGQVYNLAVNGYSHGAGIYLQNARGSIVTGNVISNTNINTDNATLVPAAIAMNGGDGAVISANLLKNEGLNWWGVAVINAPNNLKPTSVTGNSISGYLEGVKVNNSKNVVVTGNNATLCSKGFAGPTGEGAKSESIVVTGNNFSSNQAAGLDVQYMNDSSISNNVCNNNGTYGMTVLACDGVMISSNVTNSNASVGFRDNGGNVGQLSGHVSMKNTGAPMQLSSPRLYTFTSPEDISGTVGNYAPVRDIAITGQQLPCGNATLATVTSGAGDVLGVSGLNVGQYVTVIFDVPCTLKSISSGAGAKFKLSGGADTPVLAGDVYQFVIKSGAVIVAIKLQ